MTKTCNTRSCRTSRIWGAGKILLIVYIVWLSILCYFCVYGRCLARDLLCFHYCFFFLFYHAVATAANKDVYITEENSHHSSPQSPWQGAYCRCKNLLHNLNQFHMLRNTKLRSMLTKGGDETQTIKVSHWFVLFISSGEPTLTHKHINGVIRHKRFHLDEVYLFPFAHYSLSQYLNFIWRVMLPPWFSAS